ncbi:unnamed protein product [Pleuronectes platessa]|uniref:Uncharacterized protein n=1 Tax=Pleuronectes platessa TaxID=8262 RepID=A0A9N7VN30_PLEPL|nr:unnamed protein product [Pleuronectes platessa]
MHDWTRGSHVDAPIDVPALKPTLTSITYLDAVAMVILMGLFGKVTFTSERKVCWRWPSPRDINISGLLGSWGYMGHLEPRGDVVMERQSGGEKEKTAETLCLYREYDREGVDFTDFFLLEPGFFSNVSDRPSSPNIKMHDDGSSGHQG